MRFKKPSPAMAVALVALFVALGGTGYAAVTINGKNIKNSSIANKKLKKKTIQRSKVKNDTLTGGQIAEATLGKVPRAAIADNAATLGGQTAAAINEPKAYALIRGSGDPEDIVDETRSKGITEAMVQDEDSDNNPDFVCFNNLGFTPKHVQATAARSSGSANLDIINASLIAGSFCPGTEQAVVQSLNPDGAPSVSDFYVAFW
jgi:hypothetical protein